MRKEVLINNSRWRRIRKRVKSIGVMTRGKAERRSIFPAGRKTYVSEIEKEKYVWGGGRRLRRWRKSRRRNKGCERVECIYVVPPFPPPPRHPQAEEKLSAGFEFEKQMKKFNDVELRCQRHYPRPGGGIREWIPQG